MSNHNRSSIQPIVLAALLWFSAGWAWPCVCTEFPTFDEALKDSPVALVVSVDTQGRLNRERLQPAVDVAYLDATVVEVLKGGESRPNVRIWDPWVGSSCSSDWRPLVPGTLLALAVFPATAQTEEFWEAMELSPSPRDYIIVGCGTQWLRLESEDAIEGLRRRAEPQNKALHQSKRGVEDGP